MKKTGDQFKAIVEKNGITRWDIRNCPTCNYAKGYVFQQDKQFYDSECDCYNGPNLQPRDWEGVAAKYNRQNNKMEIAKYDKFWGFTE